MHEDNLPSPYLRTTALPEKKKKKKRTKAKHTKVGRVHKLSLVLNTMSLKVTVKASEVVLRDLAKLLANHDVTDFKELESRLKMSNQDKELRKWAQRPDVTYDQVKEAYLLNDKLALTYSRSGLHTQAGHHEEIAKILRDEMHRKL